MDEVFQNTVLDYYSQHGRRLPWRERINPYRVFVSEYMLQQTQVGRVERKFPEFFLEFPNLQVLASSPLSSVVKAWSGLGYNRRAKYLHQSAKIIIKEYEGRIPKKSRQLEALPGIGPNTAGAILAYAYNQPSVFIETNIRAVYLHHFFNDRSDVDDQEIIPLISQTLNRSDPRTWYWALMDYGTHLKRTLPNPNRRSKQYALQSRFEGSNRQIRGQILRELTAGPVSFNDLVQKIDDVRLKQILVELVHEGLIEDIREEYRLAD